MQIQATPFALEKMGDTGAAVGGETVVGEEFWGEESLCNGSVPDNIPA